MSNAQTQALASKLSKFTSKCREALEDAGISLTHKDNKDQKDAKKQPRSANVPDKRPSLSSALLPLHPRVRAHLH